MNNALWCIGANVLDVCVASVTVIVSCPLMNNPKIRVFPPRSDRSVCNPTGATKQFPHFEFRHHNMMDENITQVNKNLSQIQVSNIFNIMLFGLAHHNVLF
jgi:hypothetical protein